MLISSYANICSAGRLGVELGVVDAAVIGGGGGADAVGVTFVRTGPGSGGSGCGVEMVCGTGTIGLETDSWGSSVVSRLVSFK